MRRDNLLKFDPTQKFVEEVGGKFELSSEMGLGTVIKMTLASKILN